MKPKPKIGILSLGCPRNLVDSETVLGRLNLKGYPVVDMGEADIGIINTCAFIGDAKQESVDAILDLVELKKSGQLRKIIVYGCLTQRYKEAIIKEIPEVDAVVGRLALNHSSAKFPITPKHYAYLKICEGCVNNCSYCIIPAIKGKFSSLDMDSLLKKARVLDGEKLSELNIIGQDITGYGVDLYGKPSLAELIKSILKETKNIPWIRLLYMHPSRVTEELLDLIRDESRICKYIDLPIQHINERILKLMGRNTPKRDIIRLIEKIRKGIPGIAIRTSIIVGFPSETDKEFEELLEFIKDVKFERLGAFIYSREEGTVAYKLAKQIPQDVKNKRFNAVMSNQQIISEEINKRCLGGIMDVLIDAREDGCYLGRTQQDAPEVDGTVFLHSRRELKPGDLVRAKITDTLEYDLVGEVE